MALGAILSLSSCHEVEETIANVVVLNDRRSTRERCEVRLYAFGSVDEDFVGEPRFDTTAFSNAAGQVLQLFGILRRRAKRALPCWTSKLPKPHSTAKA